MRSKVILVILLICVIGFGIFSINLLEKDVQHLNSILYEILYYVNEENWTGAISASANLPLDWDIISDSWCVLVAHDEIEKISIAIVELLANIQLQEKSESVTHLYQLIKLFEHIPENEVVRFNNIF